MSLPQLHGTIFLSKRHLKLEIKQNLSQNMCKSLGYAKNDKKNAEKCFVKSSFKNCMTF